MNLLIDWISDSEIMRVIRISMLFLVPCLLLTNSLLIVGSIAFIGAEFDAEQNFYFKLYEELNALIPLMIAACMGYFRASHYKLSRLPVGFLCLTFLAIILAMPQPYAELIGVIKVLLAIILPLITLPILAFFSRITWLEVLKSDIAGDNVRQSLNLILPGILTAIVLWVLTALTINLLPHHLLPEIFDSFELTDSPYQSGLLFTLLNSTFWFFGINGAQALIPLIEMLNQAVIDNAMLLKAGSEPENILNISFLASFVFLGGCGSTISLIIAILLRVKDPKLILIALISIPMALFNVNEILLFSLPIILNPRLFIPFLLVPMVNVVLSLAATESGLVPIATAPMPFTSPIFFNALLVTGGDYSAVVLQLFNIIIGTLIYLPFVKKLDQQHSQVLSPKLLPLESDLGRLLEKANTNLYDTITDSRKLQRRKELHQQQLSMLIDKEFILRYQPQVDLQSSEVVGFEALIRVTDPDGNEHLPGTFLPWLEDSGLLHEVDAWVAQEVLNQSRIWAEQGIHIPISVNTSLNTLERYDRINQYVKVLKDCPVPISIEIVENALSKNLKTVQDSIDKLHDAGISVHIDDFGTGYSSLSYLHHFDIDTIKIDRNFVTALNTSKGRKVFNGIMEFSESLDLDVVVEGVETFFQLHHIPEKSSIAVQGHIYSEPLLAKDVPNYLKKMS